ncbi:HAD family hydrolase [Paenibacillus donghaensis]|uniref:Haloacid dehalogenase n=1 Tax=Paenibacillus donghaensis TaxID=414771 RepID=A0A2Z2KGM3_9BACL|nr:HAD family hydrolase [Paenibacillus donghaensis]ASA19972.1 haloacid dehalogenase [Paenibacillus donghaensis]
MPILHVNGQAIACQGILFDKDGTLLDLMATWGTWAELVIRSMEAHLTLIGGSFTGGKDGVLGTSHNGAGQLTGYDPSGPFSMATPEETHGILAWQLYSAGVPWNEALTRVMNMTKEASNELRKSRAVHPLPGLVPFLQQCAGASLKLGVVTSDEAQSTAEHLEWLGISGYFGTVVTRDRVIHGKPAPEMAETACRELGLDPEQTILIGDSNADMQMGRGAGLSLTIGIASPGAQEHLADADRLITGYDELKITVNI